MKAGFATSDGQPLQLAVNVYSMPSGALRLVEFERRGGPVNALQGAVAAIMSALVEYVEAPPA